MKLLPKLAKIKKAIKHTLHSFPDKAARKTPKTRVLKSTAGARKSKKARRGFSGKDVLIKHDGNPVIAPTKHAWESKATFNPGAVLFSGKIHLLYRAIGDDDVSRLGYAALNDDLALEDRHPYPAYEHPAKSRTFNQYARLSGGGGWGGAEDPRLVRVGNEDVFYMTYTACADGGLAVGLTSITIDDFLHKRWRWKKPVMISPPNQVHKNWVIFPEKINGKYAILHSIRPKVSIAYVDKLDFKDSPAIESDYDAVPVLDAWERRLRGAGAPPIRTKNGWLLFYHAMDNDASKYKVGAMLLDLNDPTKVLSRSSVPVLEPRAVYENEGFKPGIVYVSGAVVSDGELFITYGGADKFVCVAHANLDTLLRTLNGGGTARFTAARATPRSSH